MAIVHQCSKLVYHCAKHTHTQTHTHLDTRTDLAQAHLFEYKPEKCLQGIQLTCKNIEKPV